MYTVSKAPHHVLSKSRMLGVPPKLASSEPATRAATNGSHQNGHPDMSGPRPVFGQVNSRRLHSPLRRQQEDSGLPQHEELAQYLHDSWTAVCREYEHARIGGRHQNAARVVYQRPATVNTPEFEPCNFERIWADHHYRSIVQSA
ncbi:hypothetical protein HPB47_010683 [Ixodes persulcatus]|uniref:Uncharacterized protein n=1 Tax=Ixodes persulcatus TaxID=34615 RepID=A0AC60NYD8_IXOPE|nr:hypothetical protein HPB47_010683 [Ixodes persulcatus]